jgi:hypothetical protein
VVDRSHNKYTRPSDVRWITIEDLEPDRQYQFWVTAVTNAGEGLSSNVVTQTPSARGTENIQKMSPSVTLVLLLLLVPPFFPLILFVSTTLLTGMTGISLHMQWPLTSLSHGSFLKKNNWCFVMDKTDHQCHHSFFFSSKTTTLYHGEI